MQESAAPPTGSKEQMALLLHGDDNVVVVLQDTGVGRMRVLGGGSELMCIASEPVRSGHKVAVRPLAPGEPIVKYGVPIGFATAAIPAGGWVHTHNCRSRNDERSHTLDPHTGAATDTRYV